MKIIQNTLKNKNTEKNFKCLNFFLGRPPKSRVGRVSCNETFFLGLSTKKTRVGPMVL